MNAPIAFRAPTFEEAWLLVQLHDMSRDRYVSDVRAPGGMRLVHHCESCDLEHDDGDEHREPAPMFDAVQRPLRTAYANLNDDGSISFHGLDSVYTYKRRP